MPNFTTTLTIPSGQTVSNAAHLDAGPALHALAIQAPATLPETVTLAASHDGTTFADAQSAASDITIPANRVTVLTAIPYSRIRLRAGSAVAADRVFVVTVQPK